MDKKVILFGWDGVPPNIILEGVERGYLPNLKRLMETGSSGVVNAVIPLLTPPNWYTVFTGFQPEKHGMISFTSIDSKYEFKYTTTKDLRVPAIWDILSRYGRKGIYHNIPCGVPYVKIQGIWIGDDGINHDIARNHVYPARIFHKLNQLNYRCGYPFASEYPDKFIENTMDAERRKLDTWIQLMEEEDWDLSVFIARSPDFILHHFYGFEDYREMVYESLKMLDDYLGILIERFGDVYIIVMSDHGQDRNYLFINLVALLEREGLLKIKKSRKPSLKSLKRYALFRYLWTRLPISLRRSLLNKFLGRVFDVGKFSTLALYNIDWSRTYAFPFGENNGSIKINYRDVYQHGIVDRKDVDDIIDKIVTALDKLHFNDKKLVRSIKVVKSYDADIPDVMIEPSSGVWFTSTFNSEIVIENRVSYPRRDIKIDPYEIVATHIREGFYVVSGKAIKKNRFGDVDLNMTDLTPIMLYLLDLPIPDTLDGKLNIDIIDPGHLRENPPRYKKFSSIRLKTRIRDVRKKLEKTR